MRDRNLVRYATRLLAAGSFGVAALVTHTARASDEFPQTIADELATPCVPQCTLCHKTNQGGPNTTDRMKPFLLNMLQAGLIFGNPDTVPTALNKLATDMTDSDGDGMIDTEELAAERNPNEPGEGQLCGGPTYGCGARIAPSRRNVDPSSLGAALATALGLLFAARRRGASRARSPLSAVPGANKKNLVTP